MKRNVCINYVVVLLGINIYAGIGAAYAMPILSDFEGGMEGWTRIGDSGSTLTWSNTAGGGGHCLRLWDYGAGESDRYVAPGKFLGDLSWASTISLDVLSESSDWYHGFHVHIKTGSKEWIKYCREEDSEWQWFHYAIPMTDTIWGVGFEAALTNVTGIEVGAEIRAGREISYLDNFAIIPEPATLTLLALGGMVVLRRR